MEKRKGSAVKGIGVLVALVGASGLTYGMILENAASSSDVAVIIDQMAGPVTMGLGYLTVPIGLYILYKGVLTR